MGLFDSLTGFFTGQTARDASNQQIQGLQAGYGQASDLLGQGRSALTSNYTAGLQPFLQNYSTAQGGVGALTDALGITGDPSKVQARFAQTPGYQFQQQQGDEGVLRNASRTGTGNSGAVNLDLQRQGQGLANTTYQQYVNNLMPFLGASGNAASGIGGLYSGLGQGLSGSYGNQAQAAYGTQTGIGNSEANATLAQNSGIQNLLGLGMNALSLGSGGAGSLAGKAGSSLFGNFTNFLSPGSGSFNTPKTYADGGRPSVGQPSIIGERGAEVFVPDRPGTIIPHELAFRHVTPKNDYASRFKDFLGSDARAA